MPALANQLMNERGHERRAGILGAVEDNALHAGGTIRAGMPRQQRRVTAPGRERVAARAAGSPGRWLARRLTGARRAHHDEPHLCSGSV
jgi:hypothetical protein